jgi:hypothetical protein
MADDEWAAVVPIRRDGSDGTEYPVTERVCVFGRLPSCHVRVQLPAVSKEHCRITRQPNGQVRATTHCALVVPSLMHARTHV